MALNPSGAISIAGTTAGQSIQVELGGTGTSQMSLNCPSVRTLAGVPSGAIVMPTDFWGKSNLIPFGCATYTTSGTYSFVVPTGASKICVVCVGGGGAGFSNLNTSSGGGGGGALSYTNCIPTTPGETLTVVVGEAGPAVNTLGGAVGPGGTSSVSRSATILISAEGGRAGPAAVATNPGGQASAGVGAVRNSGGTATYWGGAGAAGYSGDGGNGGQAAVATPGSGGGGGGGASTNSPFANRQGGGGGGVGLVVAGANGAAGIANAPSGGGGSGGTNAVGRPGGTVGGGTGAHYDSSSIQGTAGGVRIIYGGVGKTYPNNSAP